LCILKEEAQKGRERERGRESVCVCPVVLYLRSMLRRDVRVHD
jgi:hypothetical protein